MSNDGFVLRHHLHVDLLRCYFQLVVLKSLWLLNDYLLLSNDYLDVDLRKVDDEVCKRLHSGQIVVVIIIPCLHFRPILRHIVHVSRQLRCRRIELIVILQFLLDVRINGDSACVDADECSLVSCMISRSTRYLARQRASVVLYALPISLIQRELNGSESHRIVNGARLEVV